jgi:hypothetical protein
MQDSKQNTTAAILPPPPVIGPLYAPKTIVPQAPPRPLPASNVRGGDLLFFEGLPFRYLEHIEELPPPPAHARPFKAMGSDTYKETLHDMISSIVKMETSWTENHNVCPV